MTLNGFLQIGALLRGPDRAGQAAGRVHGARLRGQAVLWRACLGPWSG